MAPEMIEPQESYNEKVDVWALGIFCFELTNGEPPNFADGENQVKYKITAEDPPRINTKWSTVFQDFIDKCLVKDPEQRWSAEMLIHHPFMVNAEAAQEEWCREYLSWEPTWELRDQ